MALLRDPGHRFEYVNPAYQAFFPGRQLVGRDAVEAAPELQAQRFIALIDRVYQTGETYFGQQPPLSLAAAPGQAPDTKYFDFTYQAYREDGKVAGISIFAFDVTRTMEPVFGSLLQHYDLRWVNMRGHSSAHKTMLLTAIAFNLKKLLRHQLKNTLRLAIALPCIPPERQFWCGWRPRHRQQNQLRKGEISMG